MINFALKLVIWLQISRAEAVRCAADGHDRKARPPQRRARWYCEF